MRSSGFPRPWRLEARFLPLALTAALALAVLAAPALAQDVKPTPPKEGLKNQATPPAPVAPVRLKEPVRFRVYQRDANGVADLPIVLENESQQVVSCAIFGPTLQAGQTRFAEGKLRNVPTGGPYTIQVIVTGQPTPVQVENIYVGDLWVLAGQSNMEGVGNLTDVTPPHPMVQLLGMDGKWAQAAEPLHWLVDSPDPVHSGNPADRAQRSADQHRTRTKGAGLGLPFAVALTEATHIPVGLIATAHGGTSMGQWDPKKKGEGGNSLYGSFLRQVNQAGGKVKGVLWYQGESDANPDAAKIYPKVFTDFIASVRSDLGQPELPFYFVQIGRFTHPGDPGAWNAVQDAERRIAESVPNSAVVSPIDLPLDDGIHVATPGLKRLGQRLARIALRELYGQTGATNPTFDRVNRGAGNTLVVKFKGVNIATERPVMSRAPAPMASSGMMGGMGPATASTGSAAVGLKPSRHIAGFSIRKADGTEIPLIFDAAVGSARDTVILRLDGPLPEKAVLWYGYGYNPYCNLTDALDMAVPVFGPIPLDEAK